MDHGLIIDIAICILAAWVIGVLFQVIKQPLLLAYLVAGFAVGPHGFRWVTDASTIETIASIGLILLLFLIGLEIDLKQMISAGKIITITAAVQIFGCLGLGWVFFQITGLAHSWLEALYLGVAAALSSTVIIVKVLYEKRELETLVGRITLGILVLQDLFAILFLALQPNLKTPDAGLILLALGKVVLLVSVALFVSRFVLPPVFTAVARVPELVLVGALAWCFALAGLANLLGLSREMGALVAGVAISTYPYTLDVTAKVTGIRDFFVTLFFVGLGMSIPVPTWSLLLGMIIFSMFLVGSRLLTVFAPLYLLRHGHRVSLLPAINLCQMSELSLVLLSLGRNSGDVSDRSMGLAAFAFAFLAVDSTYAIFKNDAILRWTSPWLRGLGMPDLPPIAAESAVAEKPKRIFFLGFSWVASSLLNEIRREKPILLPEITVIDFNPHANAELRRRGVHIIYGDISQREVLLHANINHASIIVCSLPDTVLKGTSNLKLLRQLRELNPHAQIIMHAERLAEVPLLYAASADYVTTPRLLEAAHLLEVLAASEKNLLADVRQAQALTLAERDEVIP
jgi:Kef-type K+ transport system membrane component KefB